MMLDMKTYVCMYFTYKQSCSVPDLSIFAMHERYNANNSANQVSKPYL